VSVTTGIFVSLMLTPPSPVLAPIGTCQPVTSLLPSCAPGRRSHRELRRSTWVTDAEVQWHGVEPHKPDWSDASRFLAYSLPKKDGGGLYVAFNTSHLPQARTGVVGVAGRAGAGQRVVGYGA
jgi:hypothetical protein